MSTYSQTLLTGNFMISSENVKDSESHEIENLNDQTNKEVQTMITGPGSNFMAMDVYTNSTSRSASYM